MGNRKDPFGIKTLVLTTDHSGFTVKYAHNECIYAPAEDTYLLGDALISLSKSFSDVSSIIEIGFGSGYLISLAKSLWDPRLIVGVDINPYTLPVYEMLYKDSSVVQLLLCNLDDCIAQNIMFDLAFSNPPYIPVEPTELKECEGYLSRSWGCSENYIIQMCKVLCMRARVVLMIASSLSKGERIVSCMEKHGCNPEIVLKEKFFFEEIYVVKGVRKSENQVNISGNRRRSKLRNDS